MMLGQWRLTLRQAHEAARAGRFDEARALLDRSEVADRRQTSELRQKIGNEMVERGRRALRTGEVRAAWDYLHRAEQWHLSSDHLAPLRRELLETVAREARDRLN